ncbi:(d)CMP kinase [Candidatus Dependentiae bacterium]|nr:(d)CMP kinase [Candidatus Dependentiae bacterium]
MLITIDGPSGSGKTTLAILIAKHLSFFCFSSGYVYRALAYILKNFYGYDQVSMQNLDIQDIKAILQNDNFKYDYQHGLAKVYWIDDITPFLKDIEISKLAPIVAKNESVRKLVREYERNIIADKDAVIEGRSCGAIVYPYADLKFYIEAPVDVRAKRLVSDQLKRGSVITQQEALAQIKLRDQMDKDREIEPLQIPENAIMLDSGKNTSEELLKIVLDKVKKIL